MDENDNMQHRLFSIGRDRRLFEYDIQRATYHGNLLVKRCFNVELEAHPTACIWYPPLDSKEGLILTANDEYKMKLWNPTTENSRRTCLGPTYGGEICRLKLLNFHGREDKYLIYSTAKKVIGLIKLLLDGNPHKTMGLIAHPDEVTDICASNDGRFIFTCGGDDLAVNMWQVDVSPIEQAIALGGEGIEPFINLIEGGRDGQTFQDMNDFFYYAMIRSKEENTTRTRKLNGYVPVDQIPYLMRAMGYYPTGQEEKNMICELRYSVLAEKCEPTTHVNLDTFIQLFVNHRPVYGIGKNNIEDAFNALLQSKTDGDYNSGKLSRRELIAALENEGEDIKMAELGDLLQLLVGERNVQSALPDQITADDFAENILGFEEVDENEIDEEGEEYDEAGNTVAMGGSYASGAQNSLYMAGNDVIPEEP